MIDMNKLSYEDGIYAQHIKAISEMTILNGHFNNSGINHAKIVLATIFDKAEKELKILAESLTSPVAKSELYIDNIHEFLNKNNKKTKVKVLVKNDEILNNNPLLLKLFKAHNNQVDIRIRDVDVLDNNKKSIHFTLADDKIYRLEENIVDFKAYGSFNNSNMNQQLSEIFERIFEAIPQSRRIILQSI
jgi:hypothetical protein